MNAAVLVGIVALLAVVVAGGALAGTAPRWAQPGRMAPLRRRLSVAGDGLVRAFGRPLAGLSVVLASAGFLMAVLWALGELAQKLEPHVDHPAYVWFAIRQVEPWSSWWWFLTDIGSVTVTQRLAAVAAVVFAILYAVRGLRWWAPPALLVSGFLLEKGVQETTKILVDRGHPPTTLGSWPSGGCARVLVVYGLIVFLALHWARVRSVRVWVAGWTVVALAETVQAYARTYNLEHWLTDVLGGILFGIMLLLTMLAVARLVLPPEPEPGRRPARRARRAGPAADPSRATREQPDLVRD